MFVQQSDNVSVDKFVQQRLAYLEATLASRQEQWRLILFVLIGTVRKQDVHGVHVVYRNSTVLTRFRSRGLNR